MWLRPSTIARSTGNCLGELNFKLKEVELERTKEKRSYEEAVVFRDSTKSVDVYRLAVKRFLRRPNQ